MLLRVPDQGLKVRNLGMVVGARVASSLDFYFF